MSGENNVILGLGVEVYYTESLSGTPTWVKVGQLSGIDGLDLEVEMWDSTGLKPIAEQVPTLFRAGDFGFKFIFDPEETTHAALLAFMKAKTLLYWKMVFPDPVGPAAEAPEDPLGFQWAAYLKKYGLTGFENSSGVEGAVTSGITGDVTELA